MQLKFASPLKYTGKKHLIKSYKRERERALKHKAHARLVWTSFGIFMNVLPNLTIVEQIKL